MCTKYVMIDHGKITNQGEMGTNEEVDLEMSYEFIISTTDNVSASKLLPGKEIYLIENTTSVA